MVVIHNLKTINIIILTKINSTNNFTLNTKNPLLPLQIMVRINLRNKIQMREIPLITQ